MKLAELVNQHYKELSSNDPVSYTHLTAFLVGVGYKAMRHVFPKSR